MALTSRRQTKTQQNQNKTRPGRDQEGREGKSRPMGSSKVVTGRKKREGIRVINGDLWRIDRASGVQSLSGDQ